MPFLPCLLHSSIFIVGIISRSTLVLSNRTKIYLLKKCSYIKKSHNCGVMTGPFKMLDLLEKTFPDLLDANSVNAELRPIQYTSVYRYRWWIRIASRTSIQNYNVRQCFVIIYLEKFFVNKPQSKEYEILCEIRWIQNVIPDVCEHKDFGIRC